MFTGLLKVAKCFKTLSNLEETKEERGVKRWDKKHRSGGSNHVGLGS